jgi:hypothetical protein
MEYDAREVIEKCDEIVTGYLTQLYEGDTPESIRLAVAAEIAPEMFQALKNLLEQWGGGPDCPYGGPAYEIIDAVEGVRNG